MRRSAARQSPRARALAAFFGLAALVSLEYATLIQHPPAGRVLGVAAIATAGGAALAGSARMRGPAPLAAALRVLLLLATFAGGLLAIGVPPALLLPGQWAALVRDLRGGFDGLEGWLWPFRGQERWPRVTVLAVLPVALMTASASCFWPSSRRLGARRALALATLIALLLAGVVNQTAPAWRVQGLALLLALAAWLWLPSLSSARLSRAALWLAAAAAGALALVPVLDGRMPWIDYRSWDPLATEVAFDWDQTYGPISWSRSTATMFTIAEPRPELLKVTALDRFDGVRFLRSDAPPGRVALDLAGAGGASGPAWGPNASAAAGLAELREEFTRTATSTATRTATVTLAGLRSTQLVDGGGLATGVEWLGGAAPQLRRAADGTLALASAPASGTRYRVSSYAPAPAPAVMRAAGRAFPGAYLAYARFELPAADASGFLAPDRAAEARAGAGAARLVGAPAPGVSPASDPAIAARIEASPYGPMFALARRLAAGAASSFDVVERTARYLIEGYRYNEHPRQARYPLEAFLFGRAGGYCQQFSGAMTLMLRMDGIPARVAVGFAPSVYDPASGGWVVRALDAHAWVEVYFAGIGWVPFDPTPPSTTPLSLQGTIAPSQRPEPAAGSARGSRGARSGPAARRAGALPAGRGGALAPWALAPFLAIALGALALGWRWLAAAGRLRCDLEGDASGAVAELRAALARVDFPVAPTTTLAQLEARLCAAGQSAAGRYVGLLARARYAAAPGARATPRDRRELRRALAAGRGVAGALRAVLALPPGVERRA
ncbi:MAG TPA: transglutaminase-like domain-containing protein [Solirubrobacteraceae bacterium]|nr:transglutaminase-like domain-containing protein [Solirubrobacteraceae bacterium]